MRCRSVPVGLGDRDRGGIAARARSTRSRRPVDARQGHGQHPGSVAVVGAPASASARGPRTSRSQPPTSSAPRPARRRRGRWPRRRATRSAASARRRASGRSAGATGDRRPREVGHGGASLAGHPARQRAHRRARVGRRAAASVTTRSAIGSRPRQRACRPARRGPRPPQDGRQLGAQQRHAGARRARPRLAVQGQHHGLERHACVAPPASRQLVLTRRVHAVALARLAQQDRARRPGGRRAPR